MKLADLRKKIDEIDTRVLKLLNKRAFLTLGIGKLKARKGASVYVPNREKEVYDNLIEQNKGPLSNKAVRGIYREVMSGALALEKPVTIAYLGPPTTFTHLAGLEKFGSQVKYADCRSISDIFTEVERDRADYGVVPIENSIEGAVTHTLDMFVDSSLLICSEIMLEISHNLLARNKKNKIKKVYSNPQVFGQCRIWLETNLPKAELVEVFSTTKAAQIAAQDKNVAAIASVLAAEKYKLKIIAESIEDNARNVTRFLVIGKVKTLPTKRDKTSIVFSVKDKVGTLHNMLLPFKKYDINLTKIESRPSKRKVWEYYFFVDLEGHCEKENVRKAVSELERKCVFFKVLGSYPVNIS